MQASGCHQLSHHLPYFSNHRHSVSHSRFTLVMPSLPNPSKLHSELLYTVSVEFIPIFKPHGRFRTRIFSPYLTAVIMARNGRRETKGGKPSGFFWYKAVNEQSMPTARAQNDQRRRADKRAELEVYTSSPPEDFDGIRASYLAVQ